MRTRIPPIENALNADTEPPWREVHGSSHNEAQKPQKESIVVFVLFCGYSSSYPIN